MITVVQLGGTGTTYSTAAGAIYGINPNVQAQCPNPPTFCATNLYGVNGGEFDIQVFAGATTATKYGLDIVQGQFDAVQGTFRTISQ